MKTIIILSVLFVGIWVGKSSESKDFSVSIDKAIGKISENEQILTIPTYLKNESNDTLYYLSMSCSWQDYYLINDSKFQIVVSECDKNIPIIIRIAPHQSRKVNLELRSTFGVNNIDNLKIGYNFIYAKSKEDLFSINENIQAQKAIIWSNKYKASR